ncbi:hypothetical protein ABK040_003790 [Willaertia magna]
MKQDDCSINSNVTVHHSFLSVKGEAVGEPEVKSVNITTTNRLTKVKQLTSKLLNYEFKFSFFSKRFNFSFNSISKSFFVFLNCVLMIFFISVQSVLVARTSNQMRNYQYFLGSVFLPLLVTLVLMPILLFKIFITKTITKESIKSVAMWKIAGLGFINTFANLFTVIPSAFVSGNVNLAVHQAVIINTFILSFLFLSTRFNALHYGGVFIVMIGIVVDIFPIFLHNTYSPGPHSKGNSGRSEWPWALLIYFSTLLSSFSNVLFEKILKKTPIDMIYLQGMTSLWVFLFGLITFWITFIPLPFPFHYIQPSEFPQYIINSSKCIAGINSQLGDNCENISILIAAFTFFYVGNLITTLIVFKYGSSTLAVVISALRIITANICFMVPFIAGPLTSYSLSGIQIESLIILVCGVVMYGVTKEKKLENDPIKKFITKIFISITEFFKTLFTNNCLIPMRNILRNQRRKNEESTQLLS